MTRRPCELDWIRDIRDQCVEHHVAFFLKQIMANGKMDKSSELDGEIWRQFPASVRSLEDRSAILKGTAEAPAADHA